LIPRSSPSPTCSGSSGAPTILPPSTARAPTWAPSTASGIFYHSEAQRQTAEFSRREAARLWPDPIVTTIEPLTRFYPAEDYHRDYYRLNPGQTYCRLVIAPKLKKFAQEFAGRLAR